MKILFFGTPLFAEIVLKKVMQKHEVVGVVCRSDKPANRGKKMVAPEIKNFALANGIPVYQFEKLKPELDTFRAIDCDIFVTASYGKILPKDLLDIKMCINVHPSLLPKYRGATPIQNALLNGDTLTGVTIMKTEVGMDDGDILLQEEVKIADDDDYNTLLLKLAEVGGEMLIKALEQIENKTVKFQKQDESQATFVKLIQKEDGLLDFSLPAERLKNMVRAYVDSPVAYFNLGDDRIKVYKAEAVSGFDNLEVGEIYTTKKEFYVKAQEGALKILKCQCAGGKVLDAPNFLNGYRFKDKKVTV